MTDSMTVAEAAAALRMHPASVRRLVSLGRLDTVRVDGRTYLVTAASVSRYADTDRRPEMSDWSRDPPP